MRALEFVLSQSQKKCIEARESIQEQLLSLPRGSIKQRRISGSRYFYLQWREGKKVKQRYLGKQRPAELMEQLNCRKSLQKELKEIKKTLLKISKLK